MSKKEQKSFDQIIRESIRETLSVNNNNTTDKNLNIKKEENTTIKPIKNVAKITSSLKTLKEAIVAMPKSFILKTERLSRATKSSHENLYKKYVETFNKTSSKLDGVDRDSSSSNGSDYRSLKIDETYNLNGIKLHELYFNNISDLNSKISVDSLPYMRLSRDWGTFEKWQLDFIATCSSARNGWGITVFDPYKNIYMNAVVDSHNLNIPLGAIPIIVMDMWEHAYFKDYLDDKKSYLIGMMKELNWDVIEARMNVVEKSSLDVLYQIKPLSNENPDRIVASAEKATELPITDIEPSQGTKPQTVEKSTEEVPSLVPEQPGTRRNY